MTLRWIWAQAPDVPDIMIVDGGESDKEQDDISIGHDRPDDRGDDPR